MTRKAQGLQAYGLLMGKVVGSRPRRGSDPHWLLLVQPADPSHPVYRVAINLQTSGDSGASGIQYQVVDLGKTVGAASLVGALRKRKTTDYFVVAEDDPTVPRLDYVRGGSLLGLADFKNVVPGAKGGPSALEAALTAAAATKGATVAVFGTGSPVDHRTGARRATGYQGIDNVHMNQGSYNAVGGDLHYLENGPNQDGALIFFLGAAVKGFFIKFSGQTLDTDPEGNPAHTGVKKLDATPKKVRAAILKPPTPAQAPQAPTPAATPAKGAMSPPTAAASSFVFADTNPNDEEGQFKPDNDDGTYKTPFVMSFSSGKTRGPVPTPTAYPTLDLSTVVGQAPPGYAKTPSGETIAFDVIGDSGPVIQAQLPKELTVTDLLVRNAQASPPAFLFHVGDVVYYYGEGPYYYGQFFEPFRSYPAPIFAIPGNHDGVTYSATMVSLQAFQATFCASSPGPAEWAAGIKRSTITQPGVYFTLDAPLVSIIGLYSNCSESIGWLDEQQLLFLYHELVRLKALRQKEGRAVILAIHHCPRWFPGQKPADSTSTAIDNACAQAQFWPDAVVCGHAHIYQRIVRQSGGRDVPYIITGAGGYGLNAGQALAKNYTKTLPSKLTRLLVEYGYVRATVSKPSKGAPTLRFEYNSTSQTTNEPDDVCVVNLTTNKLM
ncbi:MAG: DUF2278 family protein [Polyangiaceae bacterium]